MKGTQFFTNDAGTALLSGVIDDVVQRVNDYSAQHVAVTMWAFAKLDTTPCPDLMQVCHMQEGS